MTSPDRPRIITGLKVNNIPQTKVEGQLYPIELPPSMPVDLWNSLIEFSAPYMFGREDGEHHTMTAVYLATEVASAALSERVVEQDVTKELVLISFLHDLGYATLDTPIYGKNHNQITPKAKKDHQEQSAILTQQFFDKNRGIVNKYFSYDKQSTLKEIVRVHDSFTEYDSPDYVDQILLKLFVEVDSLAAIDMSLGLPSFPKDKLTKWLFTGPRGYQKVLNDDGTESKRYKKTTDKGRVPHFITKYSKQKYNELSKELIKYANNL